MKKFGHRPPHGLPYGKLCARDSQATCPSPSNRGNKHTHIQILSQCSVVESGLLDSFNISQVTLPFTALNHSDAKLIFIKLRAPVGSTSRSNSDGFFSLRSISISPCNITSICCSGLIGLLPGWVDHVSMLHFVGKDDGCLEAKGILKGWYSSALRIVRESLLP